MPHPHQITTPYCALKARSILAWGNAPGSRPSTNCGLKARARRAHRHHLALPASSAIDATLIPHIPLIELHSILRKHRPHLCLEIAPLVMHGLRIDIPHQCRSIAQPHGKCRVSTLPSDLRELRRLGLDPFRRRNLQPLHQLRHGLRSRDEQRNMDVIAHATHPHTNVLGPDRRRQNRMHLAADRIRQQRPSALRAENQMHQNVRERLRHAPNYSADRQSAPVTTTTSWGDAPGYKTAGLQPALSPTSNPNLEDA